MHCKVGVAGSQHYTLIGAVYSPEKLHEGQKEKACELGKMPLIHKKPLSETEPVGNSQVKALVTAAETIGAFPSRKNQSRCKKRKPDKALNTDIEFSGLQAFQCSSLLPFQAFFLICFAKSSSPASETTTATKMRTKPINTFAVSTSPKNSTEMSAPKTASSVRSMAAVALGV